MRARQPQRQMNTSRTLIANRSILFIHPKSSNQNQTLSFINKKKEIDHWRTYLINSTFKTFLVSYKSQLTHTFISSFYSYYQSPYYANHTSTRSSVSRYGGDESNNTSSYGSKNRRMSRDEDTNSGYGESINNAVPNSPPYYSNTTYGAGRRSSFSRVSTMDDDDGDNNSSGNSYESGGVRSYYNSTTRKPYQLQPSALATHNAQASDRHGSSGSTAAYYRQKLAKSKSSHAIGKTIVFYIGINLFYFLDSVNLMFLYGSL